MARERSSESPSGVLRIFIALPVPELVKQQILLAQEELRRALPKTGASWTRPEQWHLTLKFLGNVEPDRIAALTEAVRRVCDVVTPLKLRATHIGCFPDSQHPRVVWVGVHDGENRLAGLARAVQVATASFTTEKPEGHFTGHITLARSKHWPRPQAEILAQFSKGMEHRVFGVWTAEAVEVMRSELMSGGARHSCVARLPFKALSETT